MPTTPTKKRLTKADRAVQRLLSAVDRSIHAADDARKARDEIIRLSADHIGAQSPDRQEGQQ